jgi:beta-galactosidase/beta-glucuronidase
MKKILIGLLIISLSGLDICGQFTPVPESSSISLNRKWKFNPSPGLEVFESSLFHNSWKDINVPGEWIMQGFVVQSGVRACYQTLFLVPGGWDGRRIMLRFDAVYSDAIVWVNGKKAGTHTGGFNIFEIDITSLLKKGSNLLTVGVMNESIADTLSCGSQYAAHALGGIPRKVTLFSVPDLHISDIFITTDLDDKYKNAAVKLDLAFKNSGIEVSTADLEIDLFSPDGKSIWTKTYKIGQLQKKEFNDKIIIDVNDPLKWNAEYPSLYKLRLQLSSSGGTEIIERKVGVRKIEVVGNEVFLNGTAIKLHGINRHEVHPLKGRSLNMELW